VTKGNPSLSALFQGLKPKIKHTVVCCHPEPFGVGFRMDPDRPMKGDNICWIDGKVSPCDAPDARTYFQFENGTIRRQIGEGHSQAERRARKAARKLIRENVLSDISTKLFAIAAELVGRDLSLRPAP
jgi:hypothetical protein